MADIKIRFYPHVDIKDIDSGLTSFIGWQRLQEYLLPAFDIKENERLVGISVTESGIKAKIEKVI